MNEDVKVGTLDVKQGQKDADRAKYILDAALAKAKNRSPPKAVPGTTSATFPPPKKVVTPYSRLKKVNKAIKKEKKSMRKATDKKTIQASKFKLKSLEEKRKRVMAGKP